MRNYMVGWGKALLITWLFLISLSKHNGQRKNACVLEKGQPERLVQTGKIGAFARRFVRSTCVYDDDDDDHGDDDDDDDDGDDGPW